MMTSTINHHLTSTTRESGGEREGGSGNILSTSPKCTSPHNTQSSSRRANNSQEASSYSDSSSSSSSSSSKEEVTNSTKRPSTLITTNHHHHSDIEEGAITPIKSNFLTKEEEEENQQENYNEQQEQEQQQQQQQEQEKQQEELLAFQNQIFLSQTNSTLLNTSNLTNISMVGTNPSSISNLHHGGHNQEQIVKTPPSRSRILSNVSSPGPNSLIIGTNNRPSLIDPITPSRNNNLLIETNGASPNNNRAHVTSPLFDSADLEETKHHQSEKLSFLENNVESLKLMKRRHRENYLPESFLHFCKHETSKIYGWSLESEKHSVQFYNKSISLHSLTTGDFSAISRLTSQNTLESTSTQDLSKNLRFKQTPIINDSVNFVIANRFVGILSDTNYRDAYMACKDIQMRKKTKQMEEVIVLESYYHVGSEMTNYRKSKIPDESFDIIYQRTPSPNTLFVSKREYLTARYFIEEPDRLIILERSIEKTLPVPSMLQSLALEHDKILSEVKKHQTNFSLGEANSHQSNQSDFSPLSSSPSRQRSRSVGLDNNRSATEIQVTPLSARTTSTHILQQSAPNMSSQPYPNDSLKNTLSNNTAPPQKGVVRANIMFQILIFDKLSDTETKFQIINNVDVKGWLKSWNSLTQKSTPHKIFEDFIAVIEEFKKT